MFAFSLTHSLTLSLLYCDASKAFSVMKMHYAFTTQVNVSSFPKQWAGEHVIWELLCSLKNDIDFTGSLSEQFASIGANDKSFHGTLDGQGHTISANSVSEHSVLFGRLEGAINVIVLDSSCSVPCSCTAKYDDHTGGITGYCNCCTIENTVSMGNVTSTGSTSNGLYFGGTAGGLSALNKETIMMNCGNYGPIAHTDYSSKTHT